VTGSPQNFRLILASASPRRRDILKSAGYVFEIVDPGDVEESVTGHPSPESLAIEKAKAKAQVVAGRVGPPFPAIVVGVDTLCALGDEVIGKPLDRADARSILSRLSGTRHRVISGVCMWPVQGLGMGERPPVLFSTTTWVNLRTMSRMEIDEYVNSGESDGKAGAYAIQEKGDRFVSSVEGSFLNVVGFPLEDFQRAVDKAGIRTWG
jgi:septum formation protein